MLRGRRKAGAWGQEEVWLKADRGGSQASGLPLLIKWRPFLRLLSFAILRVVNKASVSVLDMELSVLSTVFRLPIGAVLLKKEPT